VLPHPESRSQVFIGRFRVIGRIGRGGMGMVYRAVDETLERELAVKTLNAEGSLDEESRRRFEIEAKAAAKLQHPNIVTVFELAQDRGIPYIAMELLPGSDLETLLRAGEALLERQGISKGHSVVVFRRRHVAGFTELTAGELADYWKDIQDVGHMLERVFSPCHMNYMLLGNIVPHLHVHVVPRYLDDPAPERPLAWDPREVPEDEADDHCSKKRSWYGSFSSRSFTCRRMSASSWPKSSRYE
jgi:diadenosine tetraphosphate (Ap4A) HIT family hydrolase